MTTAISSRWIPGHVERRDTVTRLLQEESTSHPQRGFALKLQLALLAKPKTASSFKFFQRNGHDHHPPNAEDIELPFLTKCSADSLSHEHVDTANINIDKRMTRWIEYLMSSSTSSRKNKG